MNNVLLVACENTVKQHLTQKLYEYYPGIKIRGVCNCLEKAFSLIRNLHPDLVFVDIDSPGVQGSDLFEKIFRPDIELIFLSDRSDFAVAALNRQISGYLLKPIEDVQLQAAVTNARNKRLMRESNTRRHDMLSQMINQIPPHNLIGIPTMEGLLFIANTDIVRCEGLQKCTRIVTVDRSDIVSSYNIGEFRKLLENAGFFSTHKSHLINLRHVKAYNKEGTVIMSDKSTVPVSKRRKNAFLGTLTHL